MSVSSLPHESRTSVARSPRRPGGELIEPHPTSFKHFPEGICWATVSWIVAIHLGAIAAFWTFTWAGFWTMIGLYWLTGGVGICLGYHRLLSHRSFSTFKPMRWMIAWIGGLAGEGSAINWAANHRIHHARSDHEGDPHSPREGFLWSHVFWCMEKFSPERKQQIHYRWAPDLLADPVMRFLDRTFLLWHVLLGLTLTAIGYSIGGLSLAASLVVWGMFVRMLVVLHATWCINSVTHVWGYKTYDNGDDSKNLWWVALFTFGEGWHNNHHAFQRAANYGHRWWEIDTTYMTIRLMKVLRLAWDVAPFPSRSMRNELRNEVSSVVK